MRDDNLRTALENVYAGEARCNFTGKKRKLAENEVKITVRDNTLNLMLYVNTISNAITHCTFNGKLTDGETNVLCTLTRLVEDMPLLEASEHGAIRLENQLRSKTLSHPIKGVIAPENTLPIFLKIKFLLREALTQYRKISGYSDSVNTFTPKIPHNWTSLSNEKKQTRLKTLKNEFCKESLFSSDGIQIQPPSHNARITVNINDTLVNKKLHGKILIDLERFINSRLSTHLELIHHEKKDINFKRQQTNEESL